MIPLRRIGILGDIHAEDALLEEGIELLLHRGVDALLCVGDIVDGQGNLERCIDLLQRHRVLCVRGNHERWLLQGALRTLPHAHLREQLSPGALAFLQQLPATIPCDTVAGKLLLCHGLGPHDMLGVSPHDLPEHLEQNEVLQGLLLSRDFDLVVNGHTHRFLDRVFHGPRGGRLRIVNGGTLTRDHDPCVVHLDLDLPLATHLPLR
ncbi:MAG: metallophosphoesterase family protein [Polyangiaceae bacterium]|nr:metallophosphoesterase family protein [Polyangiaceae bacterium]